MKFIDNDHIGSAEFTLKKRTGQNDYVNSFPVDHRTITLSYLVDWGNNIEIRISFVTQSVQCRHTNDRRPFQICLIVILWL